MSVSERVVLPSCTHRQSLMDINLAMHNEIEYLSSMVQTTSRSIYFLEGHNTFKEHLRTANNYLTLVKFRMHIHRNSCKRCKDFYDAHPNRL